MVLEGPLWTVTARLEAVSPTGAERWVGISFVGGLRAFRAVLGDPLALIADVKTNSCALPGNFKETPVTEATVRQVSVDSGA